jgi:hypothetical protein
VALINENGISAAYVYGIGVHLSEVESKEY